MIVGIWADGTLGGLIPEQYPSPLASTETYLRLALGSPDAATMLVGLLARSRKGGDLVVFVDNQDSECCAFLQTLTYMAWPRRVQSIVVPANHQVDQKSFPARPAAFLFYRLRVHGSTEGIAVGPKLLYFPQS